MSALGVDIDLREDFLEDHWADELRCQSEHLGATHPACTITVVGKRTVTCLPKDVLVCAASYRWSFARMELGTRCAYCKRFSAECWSVIPV